MWISGPKIMATKISQFFLEKSIWQRWQIQKIEQNSKEGLSVWLTDWQGNKMIGLGSDIIFWRSTKWLSKPTTFGKARREVAWLFERLRESSYARITSVKSQHGLGLDNNDKVRRARSWSQGCLNCKIYSCIENLTKAGGAAI